MNWLLLTTTFIAANLDFFVILLFLLQRLPLRKVVAGYLLGLLIILSACMLIGTALAKFLPEWLLGVLGVIPIWMSLHDDDDEAPGQLKSSAGILTVTFTYLSVCAGCNLAIFLPVLTEQAHGLSTFWMVLAYIAVLTVIITALINRLGRLSAVQKVLNRYGDMLTKVCYIAIGIYVFFDSGLISHLIKFVA